MRAPCKFTGIVSACAGLAAMPAMVWGSVQGKSMTWFLHPFLAQAQNLADKRIVVAIDAWEADSPYPQGHYVRTLGGIGDRETETEVSQAALLRCAALRCVPCTAVSPPPPLPCGRLLCRLMLRAEARQAPC